MFFGRIIKSSIAMFDQNKILLSEKDKDLGKWLKESYLDDWNITVFDTRNRMTVRKWTKVEKKGAS
jgi:hypothetical protein